MKGWDLDSTGVVELVSFLLLHCDPVEDRFTILPKTKT